MKTDSSKDIILQTACALFYAKGYNSTTFQDIAQRCNVTKQAITYHFGSKAALGREVSQHYSNRLGNTFKAAVTERLAALDNLTLSAAYLIWFSGYYHRDKDFLRFFEEFVFADAHFDDIATDVATEYYLTFAPVSDLPLTELEIKIKTVSAFYAGKGLLHQYSKGMLRCGEDDFAWHLYLNYFTPYISDRNDLQRIYRQAREVLGRVGKLDIKAVG